MKNLRRLLFAALLLVCFNSYSQTGVTSYSFYALGINTSQNKTISGELKTFANRSFGDIMMEADIFYNFKPKAHHRFSIGLGINGGPFRGFDLINALTIPAQLEIFPLQDFRKFSIMFELAPVFIVEGDANLRSLWGIRYTFGELKD